MYQCVLDYIQFSTLSLCCGVVASLQELWAVLVCSVLPASTCFLPVCQVAGVPSTTGPAAPDTKAPPLQVNEPLLLEPCLLHVLHASTLLVIVPSFSLCHNVAVITFNHTSGFLWIHSIFKDIF